MKISSADIHWKRNKKSEILLNKMQTEKFQALITENWETEETKCSGVLVHTYVEHKNSFSRFSLCNTSSYLND